MQKYSLFSLLAFLVAVFIIFVFLIPQWSGIGNQRAEKINKQKYSNELKAIVAHIDELSGMYVASEENLGKLSLAIPSESELPNLLIQLDDIAVKNGMAIGDIKFDIVKNAENTGEGVDVIKINLDIKGTYLDFKKTLADIERNVRLMDVSSIGFSGIESGVAESDLIRFAVSLNTYYLK